MKKSQFWHFFPMIGGWAGRFGGCRKQKQSQHIHARSGGWYGNEAKAYNDRLGSRHQSPLYIAWHSLTGAWAELSLIWTDLARQLAVIRNKHWAWHSSALSC